MKKMFALLMAVMLCAAMVLPASATAPAAPTGTLTITNAEYGKDYTVVRVFDAEVGTNTVAYCLKDSSGLYTLIEESTSYTKPDGTTILCPFVLDETHDDAAATPVTHKPAGDDGVKEFGRGWLYGMYTSGKWTPEAADVQTDHLGTNGINNLSFTGLTYGYYMIFAEDAQIASVISVTSPYTTITDKNVRTPGDPDKEIVDEDGAMHDNAAVQVGDVVTYVASFQATNYRTYDNMSTKQITAYQVMDVAVGLKYKALLSMEIYRTKNSDGTFTVLVDEVVYDMETNPPPYVWDSQHNTYSMNIPWVDADGNSLYPSPCYVVLTYEMYVTDTILNTSYGNSATNTFKPYFVVDGQPVAIENPPSVTVHTTGLSIQKQDDSGAPLTGATFRLAMVDANGGETFYHLVDRHSDVTGENWRDVEWGAEADADIVTAANNPDLQTFGGLSVGTYHLYEVEAPAGYYAPSTPWTIRITYNEANETFAAEISSDGTTFTALSLSSPGKDSAGNFIYRNFYTVPVVNMGTEPLPQTGAAGTTMLLFSGAILFMGTMLLLVTKKRMYNQG